MNVFIAVTPTQLKNPELKQMVSAQVTEPEASNCSFPVKVAQAGRQTHIVAQTNRHTGTDRQTAWLDIKHCPTARGR